ncbi:MAG: Smr/MutS family protein [Rhodospirillales bacterium]|nr:Smr/MutS family protein [Alphaproteobacteria bacterium]MBL6928772.1 Smr/MutS family protein [Rhodospirillales bacterium]
MVKKGTDGRVGLSREDAELWRFVTQSIKPLAGRAVMMPPDEPESDMVRRVRQMRRHAAPLPMPQPPGANETPEITHGQTAGMDKRTAQRMRRGKMAIEGCLDLHGLTQEEAYRALSSFLAGSQNAGRRCVLVVTGKGTRQDGRAGVLRTNVPHWLNQPPNRARVIGFSHAAQKDGGSGALYVLLQRAR